MNARLALAVVVFAAGALALLQPAHAGRPVPYDSPAVGQLRAAPPLPTGLFALGTLLSSFGVADSELATVGPARSASSSWGAGSMIVHDDLADCPNAQFTSIQAAVTAAPPGAKIKVCPGTY